MTQPNTPLVSVGLPVYNGERFLERAIQSMVDQTLPDWELVITDNGSEDSTAEIARRFTDADTRISYSRNPENLGASKNFEIAFEKTSGKYFAWLAYDDWFDPRYLEACVEVLENNEAAAMCFAEMGVADDTGKVFRTKSEPLGPAIHSPNPIRRLHAVLWRLEDPTAPVFGLCRRHLLAKTGLIRNANEPDRILITELSMLGTIHQIPEMLFLHHGPPGHTDRDNWSWLNPKNIGKPRLATFRIGYHQMRAIIGSEAGVLSKAVMLVDLLVATVVKRTQGKLKAIRKRRRKRREASRPA